MAGYNCQRQFEIKTVTGNIIRKLRGDLSQAEFAKKVGISQGAIANYELGRFPKPEILDKIAAAAGKRVVLVIEDIETGEREDV